MVDKNNMFSSLVNICLHVKKKNKQTNKQVRLYLSPMQNGIGVRRVSSLMKSEKEKKIRVTDDKKCYRGGKKRC